VKILALDTALSQCAAAVIVDGESCAVEVQPMARGQAEALLPMVRRVLGRAGLEVADLDRIAVTVGPGSFTGVRVGLAAARGLALAGGVPAVGITTLEALAATAARSVPAAGVVVAALAARREKVYLQAFEMGGQPAAPRPLAAPGLVDVEQAAQTLPDGPCLLAGSGAGGVAAVAGDRPWPLEVAEIAPDPAIEIVAALAAAKPLPEERFGPAPLYLRPPDARLPAAPGG